MPQVKTLAQLFHAIGSGDLERSTEIAGQIATRERSAGRHGAARRLTQALAVSRPNGRPLPQGSVAVSDALLRLPGGPPLNDVWLSKEQRRVLDQVILEWRHRDALERAGLRRRSKLLLHGTPGSGKSMTARALAHEMGLPAFVVRFDAIVSALLGQTALHIRQVFKFAEQSACVVLVDEIDALGRRRGNLLDVGELDRVVIALLQDLEHSFPAGLLVATSNLPGALDDALWRRFDLVLRFPRASRQRIAAFSKKQAHARDVRWTPRMSAAVKRAENFADAEAIVVSEQRERLLRPKSK